MISGILMLVCSVFTATGNTANPLVHKTMFTRRTIVNEIKLKQRACNCSQKEHPISEHEETLEYVADAIEMFRGQNSLLNTMKKPLTENNENMIKTNMIKCARRIQDYGFCESYNVTPMTLKKLQALYLVIEKAFNDWKAINGIEE
ncbi:hypothetical protein ECANGB1_2111 [Enterospora canceri]|uniref:Uncharacterized protein n=1 Tax=Enterospora canceri TaxID=1081671 RepID=A0A1Y1S681_9MICR|nr:hypothetical protein ECANGB1_2111 [Enterospora canceri]